MDEILYETVKPIPQKKYDLLVWTEYEKLFRDRPKLRNKELLGISVPFIIALQVKLRRSVLGTFLKYFNEKECQSEFLNYNKLSITDSIMGNFNKRQKITFEYNNNLFDEMMSLLEHTITETREIDCSFFYENASHLRLDDYNINKIDDSLGKFRNLQILILCGNWIKDIKGSVLPRNLKFLELFANEIESVKTLTQNAPKHLLHLGLGRNKLTNGSSLHLLAESKRFNSLKTLDLSECDIYDLDNLLEQVSRLQNLEGLLLQGNPCSVTMGYKDLVLNNIPHLIFLDGTEITKPDRVKSDIALEELKSACVTFICPSLTGLPKPPKAEKKVKQSIHIEVFLPLVQEDFSEKVDESVSNPMKELKTEKYKEDRVEKRSEKSNLSSKKGKKKLKEGNKKSLYEKENEFKPETENIYFATERKPWSNDLNFPPLLLKSPENNLNAHRDSFRSCVNVRIIYLKVLPPEKNKKTKKDKKKTGKDKKKTKKEKKKNKKDKEKGRGSKKINKPLAKGASEKSSKSNKSKNEIKEVELDREKKEPREIILKRVTLASFYCDLFSVNWKEDGLNFCWFDDFDFGNKAVKHKTHLENLRKKEEDEKRKAQLEEARKKEANSNKVDKKSKSSKDRKSKNSKEKKKKSLKDKKSKSVKGKKSTKMKKSTKSSKSRKSKKSKESKKSKQTKSIACLVTFGLLRTGKEIKAVKKSKKKEKRTKKSSL